MKKGLLLLILFGLSLALWSCDIETEQPKPVDPPSQKQNLDINVTMYEPFVQYNPVTEADDTYIYIGMYPQREVIDTDVLAALKKLDTPNERGFLEYDGKEFYKYTVVNNHIYAEDAQSGDSTFAYATGYEPGTVHFFLVEPILWKVVQYDAEENKYTLISANIIDSACFSVHTTSYVVGEETVYPSNYEYSDIRAFLNGAFIQNAFTTTEQSWITPVTNNNTCPVAYVSAETQSRDTIDSVWLLSYQQVTSARYGFKPDGTCDGTRTIKASDLANAKGLIKHVIDGVTSSIWLMRNAHEYARDYIAYVGYDGLASKPFYPDAQNVGIRPAVVITMPK